MLPDFGGEGMKTRRTDSEIVITNVYPEIEGGRYPVKREVDRIFHVAADIDGKGPFEAYLRTGRSIRHPPPGGESR